MVSSKLSPPINFTSPLSSSQLLHLLQTEPNIHKSLLIFNSSSSSLHDHSTFSLIAARLALADLPRLAESLLSRALAELKTPPPEPSFLPLIRAYSRARRPLDSLRLLRRMSSEFLLPPSHRSYNAVLAALVANNRLPLAKSLFHEMKASGIAFNVASFNILIKALCSSGAVDAAIRVFCRMPDRGCLPDACTYSTLIGGMCCDGRIDDACKLFDEMPQRGLEPTVVTFSSLIHGFCKLGRFDDARKMFDEMPERGIEPNVVTYTSLIDGLCKGGRSMEAMELLERMARRGCSPNVRTYAALIDGLCRGDRLREALEVFDKMRLQGRKPDAGLYGKIIKSLCSFDRYREGSIYLDEMVLSGIVPNRLTWSLHCAIHNMVIRGLCGGGEAIRASQVYLSARNRGISIEVESYCVLVECLCKRGDVGKGLGIVDEMVSDGCFPDNATWCLVLEILLGRKKVREGAELVWDELVCGDVDLGATYS